MTNTYALTDIRYNLYKRQDLILTRVTKSLLQIVSSPSKNLGLTSCLRVVFFFPFLVGDELIVLKIQVFILPFSYPHALALSEFLEACRKCRISGPPPDQRESESALQQDLWVIHMQIIFGGSVCLLQCPQFLFFEDQNDKFTAGFKS